MKEMTNGMVDCKVDLDAFNNGFWRVEYYTPLWHNKMETTVAIATITENYYKNVVIDFTKHGEIKLDGKYNDELAVANYICLAHISNFPYEKEQLQTKTHNLFIISDLPLAIKPTRVDDISPYTGGFIVNAKNVSE